MHFGHVDWAAPHWAASLPFAAANDGLYRVPLGQEMSAAAAAHVYRSRSRLGLMFMKHQAVAPVWFVFAVPWWLSRPDGWNGGPAETEA